MDAMAVFLTFRDISIHLTEKLSSVTMSVTFDKVVRLLGIAYDIDWRDRLQLIQKKRLASYPIQKACNK